MKHALLFVLSLCFSGLLAQQPAPAPVPRASNEMISTNPELALAEKNVRVFGAQVARLREAVGAQNVQTTQGYYVAVLQTMRQTLEQAEGQIPSPVAGATEKDLTAAQKRLLEQRSILEAFEGFNFDFSRPETIEEKMRLLDAYHGLIKANLADLKARPAPVQPAGKQR